jgi:predicted transcriptional regulator
MARTQTLVQLSDELVAELDARASREGRSRSELIRDALAGYLHDDPQAEIDRRLVEAYTRQPQDDALGADWAARQLVAAEPWEPSAAPQPPAGGDVDVVFGARLRDAIEHAPADGVPPTALAEQLHIPAERITVALDQLADAGEAIETTNGGYLGRTAFFGRLQEVLEHAPAGADVAYIAERVHIMRDELEAMITGARDAVTARVREHLHDLEHRA